MPVKGAARGFTMGARSGWVQEKGIEATWCLFESWESWGKVGLMGLKCWKEALGAAGKLGRRALASLKRKGTLDGDETAGPRYRCAARLFSVPAPEADTGPGQEFPTPGGFGPRAIAGRKQQLPQAPAGPHAGGARRESQAGFGSAVIP